MKFSPITVLAFTGVAAAAMPSYCTVPAPDNKNTGHYIDVSKHCKKLGIADNCCVTFVDSGAAPLCNKGNLKDTRWEDLHSGLAQQVTKDGQWKSTDEGGWQFVFQLFTTALNARELFIPWNDAINDFQTDPQFEPAGVYFQAGDDDFFNQVYAKWVC